MGARGVDGTERARVYVPAGIDSDSDSDSDRTKGVERKRLVVWSGKLRQVQEGRKDRSQPRQR